MPSQVRICHDVTCAAHPLMDTLLHPPLVLFSSLPTNFWTLFSRTILLLTKQSSIIESFGPNQNPLFQVALFYLATHTIPNCFSCTTSLFIDLRAGVKSFVVFLKQNNTDTVTKSAGKFGTTLQWAQEKIYMTLEISVTFLEFHQSFRAWILVEIHRCILSKIICLFNML